MRSGSDRARAYFSEVANLCFVHSWCKHPDLANVWACQRKSSDTHKVTRTAMRAMTQLTATELESQTTHEPRRWAQVGSVAAAATTIDKHAQCTRRCLRFHALRLELNRSLRGACNLRRADSEFEAGTLLCAGLIAECERERSSSRPTVAL